MILGIDASRAVKKEKTGVEWYSYYLINAMKKIIPPDWRVVCYTSDFSLFPLWKRGAMGDFHNNKKNPSPFGDSLLQRENYRTLNWPLKHLWTQIRLSWEMWRHQPDVLFIPSHVLPLIHPKKSIVTIHDVAFERYPEFYKPFDLWYQRWSTRFALKRAYKIIVPSEFTKKELVEIYHAPAEKIVAIPHGVNFEYWNRKPNEAELCDVEKKYNLNRPYFVFVGRLESKKNIQRLLEAWRLAGLKDIDLFLAGSKNTPTQAGQTSLGGDAEDIKTPGWVSADDLQVLYHGARAMIFPTLYEGFGMPILEALAANLPVITSDLSPHKEVAGDAALFVNPLSVESIAEGIKKMASDELTRNEFKGRGEARAKHFSWQNSAQKTWEVITQ